MSSAIDIHSTQPPRVSGDHRQLSSLAPVTRQRLRQFSVRQSALSAAGGLGWILLVSIALLLLAVVIDSLVYHPATRWWLFGSLLGAVILGLVVGCLRPLMARPQWKSIARNMEQLEPRLRNQLLSAVELAMQPVVHDSLAFRHQVQRTAATLVAPVDVAELLPARLVRRPVAAGLAAVALLVLLCFVPGIHLPQRLWRILLPWADVGRISSISIAIEVPDVGSPASARVVPRGEMTGIVARITGPRPAQVWLQSRTPEIEQPPQSTLMTLVDSARPDRAGSLQPADSMVATRDKDFTSRFETVLPVDAESLEFRVVAAGAETPWYRLTTVPRPQIDQFEIVLQPPAYTKLADYTFTAKTADLSLLEGSRVRLSLATQPSATLLSGQLLWGSQSQRASTVQGTREPESTKPSNQPLRIDKSGKLFTEFSADSDREFKFELQHYESGIKNDFSPTYQLRIIKDLAPQVAWVWPKSSTLIASNQELLDLKLSIRDQLPIDSVVGRYRVNSEDWHQVDLQPNEVSSFEGKPLPTGIDAPKDSPLQTDGVLGDKWTQSACEWLFDLAKVELKDGDFLDISVVATDRKQQQGSSSSLRIMITANKLDLEPSQVEQSRQQIKQKLAELSRQLRPLADEAAQLRKQNDQPPADALQKLSELDDRLHQQAMPKLAELRQQIEQALNEPQDRVSQQELRGVGQLLEKWQHQSLPALQNLGDKAQSRLDSSEFAQAEAEKMRQQLVHPLADSTKQIIDEIGQAAESFEAVADNDPARRIAAQSLSLSTAAKQLQQALQLQQAKQPQQTPSSQQHDADQGHADQGHSSEVLDRRRQILARQVQVLEEAIQQAQSSAGKQLANQLQNTRQQLQQAQSVLERSAAEFANQAASVPQVLSQVRNQLASSIQQPANQGRRRTTQQAGTSGERMAAAIQQWESSSAQAAAQTNVSADRLSDLRSLLTSGDAADRQFAADLGNAQRALQQTTQSAESAQQQSKQVREIANSVRKLEAAHALEQATGALSQLLLREGQSQYQQEMLIEHPRLWDAYTEQLERTVRLMREAQIPNELVSKTEQLQWTPAAGQAAERIGERIWSNEPPTTAKPQLLELNGSLQSLRQQLSAIASEARQSLLQQAPSLSQLAQQAANSSSALRDETQQLAENLAANQVPDPTARLNGLKQQVAPAAKPLQTLRDALVDLAGSQNLLDKQQLDQAKKADAALSVVAQAQQQLGSSLEDIQPVSKRSQSQTETSEPVNEKAAPNIAAPEQSAQAMVSELQRAATQQSDVAGAMRRLADFFEKSPAESGLDSANSNSLNGDPQQLDQLANSLNSDASKGMSTAAESAGEGRDGEAKANRAGVDQASADQAYEQAQRLAQIAGLSPEQMLKSLERQLPNNPAMQAEMSEIASDAAAQALRQLDRAQKRQAAITPALEQSDPRVRMQKELMAHDLNLAKGEAAEMLQRLLQEADSAAQAGQVPEPAKRLQEQVREFQQTMAKLPYISGSLPIDELQASAKQISSALTQLGSEAAKIEKSLDEAAQSGMKDQNDQLQKQQLRDAQSRRDRSKNQTQQQAERLKQSQQRAVNNAKNQLRQAAQELKQQQDQLSRTEKELQKQPQQQWLKETVDRQRRAVALSESKLESVKQFQEALEQRQQTAEEFSKQLKQAAATELSQPNAYAQLAQTLSQQASQSAQQFAQQIQPWEEPLSIAPEALGSEITSQATQQANVQNQVQAAAEDLARAARHESRLNHDENSQQLALLAAKTTDVAEQPLQQSRDQLAQAQQTSAGQDRPTGQALAEATSASIAAAQQADRAIQQAAESLRNALSDQAALTANQANLAAMEAASRTPANSNSQNQSIPSSASSASPFSPQQMAQMLDELDRQLNSSGSQLNSSQSNSSQSNSSQTSSSASQSSASQSSSSTASSASPSGAARPPATLAQAAQQLAEQLSRQRQAAETLSKAAASNSSSLPTNASSLSMGRASAQPQPADSVRVLDITRINDQWGDLRQQEATQTVESQRDKSTSRYRRAIDAYFKALAESSSPASGAQDGSAK